MIILDYTNQNISVETFTKLVNDTRRTNKNTWYAFGGYVNGKKVALKGIDTWLQLYIVNSLNQPTAMDISVKQYLIELSKPFYN